MAMTAKQIVHNYMLSAVKKSKKKIQIKCTTVKDGKAVYSAIFEGWPTYAAYIDKVKSGINYKDFTLKFDKEWATEEFFNILRNVKSDTSLKVTTTAHEQTSTETPKFDDPTQPAPTNNTNPTTYTGSTYAAPGSGALTKIAGTTGNNNKTFIIAGAAVLVLVLVLVLLKRK